MSDAPDLVLACPICGQESPIPAPLDVNEWHPVDCRYNSGRISDTEDHRYWWRRRSNPVPGEDSLLEYSEFDPKATGDPETAH